MAVVQEACPACAAPLEIPNHVARIKCPYCATTIAIQRDGSEVALAIASTVAASIEKSGTQTQDAIKEGSNVTQTELRRLQVAQDLSMVQMRLSNLQGEIRSIERLPVTAVNRKQLNELHKGEADLIRQAKILSDVLNPPLPMAKLEVDAKVSTTNKKSTNKLIWLLFSTSGRANRTNYWIGMAIVFVIFLIVGATMPSTTDPATGEPASSMSAISFFLFLLFCWVGFAVSAKRYHDRGKSAWWVFVILIPVIGFFWQIVELGFFGGNPGANRYS